MSKGKPDDIRFAVNAYVDAQNGFGAMLQSHYSIDMHRGEGDTW